jgi:DNA polymerase zeta
MHRALSHLCSAAASGLAVADHLDVLGQTCELARLYGMDLFSVLTRGSQFRVEAVLARVARQERLVCLSPRAAQIRAQPAMEAQPLNLEPQSGFYASPVCVLDFRALYPSVIIAHNLSFDTCLGKVGFDVVDAASFLFFAPVLDLPAGPHNQHLTNYHHHDGQLRRDPLPPPAPADPVARFLHPGLGADATYRPPTAALAPGGFVSPSGVAFVPQSVRVGLLPRMLSDLLAARVMVKACGKDEPDAARRRVLEARQFGLKNLANVTYGYTAASFSGRMPCAELADAVVLTGRACLQAAIQTVRAGQDRWGGVVVYGDTDSLFVHLPGKSLAEARRIGGEIALAVTRSQPAPIALSFEKVYMPCILEVKKRYVGLSHAPRPGEREPFIDAKGIETVRRDACPVVSKVLTFMLSALFKGPPDLSALKHMLQSYFDRMLTQRVSLKDYVLTGKVKFGEYKRDRGNAKANYPPAAVVADRLRQFDERLKARPVVKERQPYVRCVLRGGLGSQPPLCAQQRPTPAHPRQRLWCAGRPTATSWTWWWRRRQRTTRTRPWWSTCCTTCTSRSCRPWTACSLPWASTSRPGWRAKARASCSRRASGWVRVCVRASKG